MRSWWNISAPRFFLFFFIFCCTLFVVGWFLFESRHVFFYVFLLFLFFIRLLLVNTQHTRSVRCCYMGNAKNWRKEMTIRELEFLEGTSTSRSNVGSVANGIYSILYCIRLFVLVYSFSPRLAPYSYFRPFEFLERTVVNHLALLHNTDRLSLSFFMLLASLAISWYKPL